MTATDPRPYAPVPERTLTLWIAIEDERVNQAERLVARRRRELADAEDALARRRDALEQMRAERDAR